MISVETQYFRLNRNLLLSIGLWPYQQSKLIRLQSIFFFSILMTATLVQVFPFLTLACTSDVIVQIISTASFFLVGLIQYIAFRINAKTIKDLLTQLQHIYNHLKDKNEYAIVERYGYLAKCYTAAFTIIAICTLCVLIVSQYWTNILDIILPINESRIHNMQIMTEYFIDQQKYFSLIMLHMNAACCIFAITIIATGTMLIAYVQHFCGMLKIASYRFEHVIKIITLENNNPKNKNIISNEINCAVDIHRQAIKLLEIITARFEVMFFCIILIVVICLTLNLFRLSQSLSENNVKECIIPFVISMTSMTYMFIGNYVAQDVTDHNNHVFATVYNVQWYTAPLNMQRIILFLLQKGTKEYGLCVGGLFVGSLQCFATLVKTSVSYFTVIHSTR